MKVGSYVWDEFSFFVMEDYHYDQEECDIYVGCMIINTLVGEWSFRLANILRLGYYNEYSTLEFTKNGRRYTIEYIIIHYADSSFTVRLRLFSSDDNTEELRDLAAILRKVIENAIRDYMKRQSPDDTKPRVLGSMKWDIPNLEEEDDIPNVMPAIKVLRKKDKRFDDAIRRLEQGDTYGAIKMLYDMGYDRVIIADIIGTVLRKSFDEAMNEVEKALKTSGVFEK